MTRFPTSMLGSCLKKSCPGREGTKVKLRKDAAGAAPSPASAAAASALDGRLGTAGRILQGALVGRFVHQHRQWQEPARRRPQLRGHDSKDARKSRSASSSRTVPMTLTTTTATGRWPTRRWPSRWSSRAMITSSCTAKGSIAIFMAVRSCPSRFDGFARLGIGIAEVTI